MQQGISEGLSAIVACSCRMLVIMPMSGIVVDHWVVNLQWENKSAISEEMTFLEWESNPRHSAHYAARTAVLALFSISK